jgi:phosphohistidine phosphatase
MRRLILFRHGKAEMAAATGGYKERTLVDRGRADSMRTAQWLLACGYVPDVALVSPAERTLDTWRCLSPFFSGAKVDVRPPLYLAGTETILEVLHSAPPEADTVMVVGHNPGLQELGVHLAENGPTPEEQINRIEDGFPTASAAVFAMDGLGNAVLEALYEPSRAPGLAPRWCYARPTSGGRG